MEKRVGQLWGRCAKEAFFRKTFELKKQPERAVLRIFVDTGYELFLNGRFVAHVDEWNNTRDYHVHLYLKPGGNVIAVHGINSAGHRGFAFELLLDDATSICSDETWKVADSEFWGWMLPGYDDSAWSAPVQMPMECAGAPQWSTRPGSDPEAVISPLRCSPFFFGEIPKFVDSPFYTKPPVSFRPSAEVEALVGPGYAESAAAYPAGFVPAVGIPEKDAKTGRLRIDGLKAVVSAPGLREGPEFCVDFGGECCGFFRMRTRSEKIVRFRLVYGEMLEECFHEPPPEEPLHRMLVETVSLQPGVQEWESRMRSGFRFVRIEFLNCPAEVEADGFHVRSSLYPVAYRGWFCCSDAELNRIWTAGRKTLHLCMQEYWLDAIKRDRLLWVGDTRAEALYNYYLFGDTELFRFCMRSIAECRYADGAIGSAWGTGTSLLWDYNAWWVIAMHDYYWYTGDREFLLEMKPYLCRATDWMTERAGENGLIRVPPNPLGVWMVVLDNTSGEDPFLNELYLRALRASREACGVAGDTEGVCRYESRIAKTGPAVQALLAEKPLKEKTTLYKHSTGLFEVIESLFAEGNSIEALALIRRNWGNLLACGADTLYEGMYAAEYPDITKRNTECRAPHISFCHGGTAGPCCLLPSEIAGIKPAEPGFRRFTVKPDPVDLTSFRTVVPTPHGEIALILENGVYTLLVPAGTEAEVIRGGKTFRFGAGCHSFD